MTWCDKTTVVLCAVLAVAACNSPVEELRVVHLESLRLERSACFGTCPAYAVVFDADDQVRFLGQRYVDVESAERAASAGEAEALVAALNEFGFRHFRDRYETPEDGCEGFASDSQTVILSVSFDGASKAVRQYYGCLTQSPIPRTVRVVPPELPPLPGPPAMREPGCPFPMALVRLHNRIDAILRTEAWIGNTLYQYGRCLNEWAR